MENRDIFEKNIKNSLDSAFDSEGITVSEELFQRTLASIRELPGADMNKTIAEKAPAKAASDRGRLYKRIAYIGSGVAAAFLVGFVSVNLLGNIGSKSSAKDMAAMDFAAGSAVTESKLESSASAAMSEEEVLENFAADADYGYQDGNDACPEEGFADDMDITASMQVDFTVSDPAAKDRSETPESPAAPTEGFAGFFPADTTESELEPAAPDEAPLFESAESVESPATESFEAASDGNVLLYNMVCSLLGSDDLYGSVQYISGDSAGSDFEMETKFLAALGAESKQNAGISPSDVFGSQSQVDVMFIKNNSAGGSVMIRIDDYFFKGEYDKELKIQEVKGYKLKLSDFILSDDRVPDDLPEEEYIGDGPIELTDPIRVDH